VKIADGGNIRYHPKEQVQRCGEGSLTLETRIVAGDAAREHYLNGGDARSTFVGNQLVRCGRERFGYHLDMPLTSLILSFIDTVPRARMLERGFVSHAIGLRACRFRGRRAKSYCGRAFTRTTSNDG
jgi:hypothetical protein